jgi:6-pyruvoyltetrahydropterin/6-carboxytetrahydropterin synthase
MREPLFLLKENPTAESLAKLIFTYAKSKKLPIHQVTFWETITSKATYSE